MARIASILADITTARDETNVHGGGLPNLARFSSRIRSLNGPGNTPNNATIRSLVIYAMQLSVTQIDYRLAGLARMEVSRTLTSEVNAYPISPLLRFKHLSTPVGPQASAAFLPEGVQSVTDPFARAYIAVPEIVSTGTKGILYVTSGNNHENQEIFDFQDIQVTARFSLPDRMYKLEVLRVNGAPLPDGAFGTINNRHLEYREALIPGDATIRVMINGQHHNRALNAWHDLTGRTVTLSNLIGVLKVELNVTPINPPTEFGRVGSIVIEGPPIFQHPFLPLLDVQWDPVMQPVIDVYLGSFRGLVPNIVSLVNVIPSQIWGDFASILWMASNLLAAQPDDGNFYRG
ncbi:hypothetical protein WDU94_015529 [Cyamophila willieti]